MRHLFLLDAEPKRDLRKLIILLISVLITLVVTDMPLRYLIQRISVEPPLLLRPRNFQGVQKFWDYVGEGIQPIVFTGSSETLYAIAPEVFNNRVEKMSGKKVNSVNISITGSAAITQRDLIRNLIIPNHPQIIFYGIEMRALTTEAQTAPAIIDFYSLPLGYAVSLESVPARDFLMWVFQRFNWVRYRLNLHDWLTSTRPVNQGVDPALEDDFGHHKAPGILDRNPNIIIDQFTSFKIEDFPRQMLHEISSMCKENGVTCILLNMPLHEMAYQYLTDDQEIPYLSLIQEMGLPIWDFNTKQCRTVLGDASFYNLNHLNEDGAQIFSKLVADVYAKVFLNVPLSGDATCTKLTP